jgi:hypothetical protein
MRRADVCFWPKADIGGQRLLMNSYGYDRSPPKVI